MVPVRVAGDDCGQAVSVGPEIFRNNNDPKSISTAVKMSNEDRKLVN